MALDERRERTYSLDEEYDDDDDLDRKVSTGLLVPLVGRSLASGPGRFLGGGKTAWCNLFTHARKTL